MLRINFFNFELREGVGFELYLLLPKDLLEKSDPVGLEAWRKSSYFHSSFSPISKF